MHPQVAAIQSGNTRAIARAISQVEDQPWEPDTLSLLKALFPQAGKARVVGVTGSPGAGKSTLVDQLALEYRKRDKTVGILAVDPTSPFSGGALLGDRIRMQSLSTDPDVFIRSMATRGQMGGLAPSVDEALLVLSSAGYQILIVETVGVGQDEVDIVKTADVNLVVVVPGMGDDIQTLKAGVMEIADILVINKADRPDTHRTQKELEALLSLSPRSDGWVPPIVRTVATQGKGTQQLAAEIDRWKQFQQTIHSQHPPSLDRFKQRLLGLLRDRLMALLEERITEAEISELAKKVMTRRLDPYTIIDQMLANLGLEEKK